MKCPGCSFVCSHLRDICPECLIDLRSHKKNLGLPVTNADASYSELLTKLQRSQITHASPAESPQTSSESRSIASRFLKSIGGLFGGKSPTLSTTIPPHTTPPHSALSNKTTPEIDAPVSSTEEIERAEAIPQPPVAEDRLAKWIPYAGQSTQPQTALGSSSPLTFKRHPLTDTHRQLSQGTTVRNSSGSNTTAANEARSETPQEAQARPTEQLLQEILDELPAELDNQERDGTPEVTPENTHAAVTTPVVDTVLLVTSNIFPSLTYSTGPAFQWIVPIEADAFEDNCTDDTGHSGATEEENIPENSATQTKSTATQQHSTTPRTLACVTVPTSPDIERSFVAARSSLNRVASSDDLDLSGIVSFTDTERESVLLLFSRCQDLLEGRTAIDFTDDVVTSEHRTVDAAALSAQLEQVERTIERASGAVALGKLGTHKDATTPSTRVTLAETQASGLRRLSAGIFDLVVIWLLSASLAGAFERGGLPAVIADISINGLQEIHYPLIASSLAFAPAVAIAYLFTGYMISGASLCGRMFSLSLRTKSGRNPKFIQLLLRAMSVPLAIVVGGYAPLLIGRASLLDRLTRTIVIRDNRSDN